MDGYDEGGSLDDGSSKRSSDRLNNIPCQWKLVLMKKWDAWLIVRPEGLNMVLCNLLRQIT